MDFLRILLIVVASVVLLPIVVPLLRLLFFFVAALFGVLGVGSLAGLGYVAMKLDRLHEVMSKHPIRNFLFIFVGLMSLIVALGFLNEYLENKEPKAFLESKLGTDVTWNRTTKNWEANGHQYKVKKGVVYMRGQNGEAIKIQ